MRISSGADLDLYETCVAEAGQVFLLTNCSADAGRVEIRHLADLGRKSLATVSGTIALSCKCWDLLLHAKKPSSKLGRRSEMDTKQLTGVV